MTVWIVAYIDRLEDCALIASLTCILGARVGLHSRGREKSRKPSREKSARGASTAAAEIKNLFRRRMANAGPKKTTGGRNLIRGCVRGADERSRGLWSQIV